MDIATIVGVLFGLVVIIGAIVVGGGAGLFLDIPSLAITIGGMVCATLIHFSLPQFLGIFSVIKKTIVAKVPSQAELIQRMVNYAAINRRDGALALEQELFHALLSIEVRAAVWHNNPCLLFLYPKSYRFDIKTPMHK